MSKFNETPVVFDCEGKKLLGILHRVPPLPEVSIGVVLVVGGPQYRVGSHRQFVLLARYLAKNGVPVFRFDYRGMGDSEGDLRSFENVHQDIQAAIDTFKRQMPGVARVVLWGLCDAASASTFYAAKDPRVVGLVLLNPWVRTEAGEAKAYVKSYYLSRFFSKDLWGKVVRGEFKLGESLKSLFSMISKAFGNKTRIGENVVGQCALPLPERVLEGVEAFQGDILFVLSGNDLTAEEFKSVVKENSAWNKVTQRANVEWRELPEANHTFSSREWRDQVSDWTLQWLQKI